MQKKKTAYVSPDIAGILSLFDPALDWSADLSGDEYATALKEFLVVNQEGSKDPRKDHEIETDVLKGIREEYNKVRKNKDLEYSVKKTKIKGNKLMGKETKKDDSPITDPSKLLSGVGNFNSQDIKPDDVEPADVDKKQKDLDLDKLNSIAKTVESIALLLKRQLGLEKKQQRDARVRQDKINKEDKEDDLEKKPDKKTGGLPKAIAKPVLGFFEKIKKFFLNIVIGSAVLKLFNWVKDPANAEKITKFKDFLINNAGWILGSLATLALLPTILTVVSVVKGILAGLALLGPLLPALPWILGAILVGAVAWWIGKKVTNKLQEAISGGGEFSNLDKLAKEDLEKHGLKRMRNIGVGKHSAELVGDDGKPIWVKMYGEDSLTGREWKEGDAGGKFFREKLTIGKPLHEAYIKKTMGEEKLNTLKAAADRYNEAIFERKDPLKKEMGAEIRKSNKLISETITKERNESSKILELRKQRQEGSIWEALKAEMAINKYVKNTTNIIRKSQIKEEGKIREKYDKLVKKEFPEYYNQQTITNSKLTDQYLKESSSDTNKESSSATVNSKNKELIDLYLTPSATIDKNVKPNTNVPGPFNKDKGGKISVIPGGGGGQRQSGGGGGGDSQSSTAVPSFSSVDSQNNQTIAVQSLYSKVAVD